MSIISGSLYVVSTPIGNLQDLSPRAALILKNVDLIVAEDTRHSGVMLRNIGVDTPMLAYHDHNERQQVPALILRLQKSETIALVSDAGTPLINDPGYHLVVAAHLKGIRVIPVPGPSALISALSVAGLATDRFIFEGYLPAKKVARMNRLRELATETRTMIFYEAPHRIIKSIDDAVSCFGSERMSALLKELTKLHETVYR
ncbi:MAG: 16S rRNA (cytidine(1402)-2'-O)-methyltransferase, partial [Gammaproteobacteria bacterium]